jgi:hypothetical protein
VEHGELVGERDDGGQLRRERVEARAAGREADAGDEVVLVQRLRGEVGRQQVLDAEAARREAMKSVGILPLQNLPVGRWFWKSWP